MPSTSPAACAIWLLALLALTAPQARADLFVSSSKTAQMLEYNGTIGAFVTAFLSAGSSGFNTPLGLVFDANGNLFVNSAGTNQVLEYGGATGAFDTALV
jgi:hypothetical protein